MTAQPKRTLLVTSALPYANGAPHLGHIVEYVQTDIWVRFQRMRGHDCLFIWASDAHGTPIMLKARQEGITPEQLIERVGAEQRRDFGEFDISYDNFHTTHSDENREVTYEIYRRLVAGGHIRRETIVQAYDEQARMFLPDRYVRGTCPKCGALDQYGDSCEACGATYTPADLLNAVSVVSGTAPVQKESEHLFFKLGDFEPMLRAWTGGDRLQSAVTAKLGEWFGAGLRDWDISRDEPYFGFEIPGETGKYFYVWLDAPIGYLSSLLQYCRRTGRDFDRYWKPGSDAEVYHFIGKDIVYFHTLFWPAVLQGAGYRPPTSVFAHGFLTVNGLKMSKSRGTLISARTWLDHLPAEYLRYYFASRLGDGVEDLDLNLDDFVAKVNSDIVGKLVNIASRCAGFIARGSAGRLAPALADAGLQAEFVAAGERVAALYEGRDLAGAMREIMALTDRANLYIDQQKPWLMAKDPARAAEVQAVCTQGINLFRVLAVVPEARHAEARCRRREIPRAAAADVGRRGDAAARHGDQHLRTARHASRPGRRQGAARCLRGKPEAIGCAGSGSHDGSSGCGQDCRADAGQGCLEGCGETARACRSTRGIVDRRLHESRPAHRAHRLGRTRRRRGQAAQTRGGPGRIRQAADLRGHTLGVRTVAARRPPDGRGCEPRAAQDALRDVGRHGARGRTRRPGDLRTLPRCRRDARHEGEVTPATRSP